MKQFDLLVDTLLDSKHRIIYHNSENLEILVECFKEDDIADLICMVRKSAKQKFWFKIEHVINTNYHIHIYQKNDKTV